MKLIALAILGFAISAFAQTEVVTTAAQTSKPTSSPKKKTDATNKNPFGTESKNEGPISSANDMGEERGYLLAGTGDDKTDIVVYAEFYNRAAIYSRDVDLSSTADFTRFGGQDARSGEFAGHVGPPPFLVPPGAPDSFVYQPNLNGGALTPTPHAFPNVASDPQYVPFASLPREQL